MKLPCLVMRTAILRTHRCLTLALICVLTACTRATREAHRAAPDTSREAMALQGDLPPLAVANDNRTPAGELRDGVLELRLEARQVAWQPENDPDNTVTVLAFAEEGRPARIPGPLLRVAQGTEVRIAVRNSIPESAHVGLPPNRQRQEGMSSFAGPELTVHGLRAGTATNDILHIAAGTAQVVRYRADTPGTFLYWGAMSRRGLDVRTGTDAQLTGAIVVDPAGTPPDPDERIFVITMTDAFPDSTKSPPGGGHLRASDQRIVVAAHRTPGLRHRGHRALALDQRQFFRAPDAPARIPFRTSPGVTACARRSIRRPRLSSRLRSSWSQAARSGWSGRLRVQATGSCTVCPEKLRLDLPVKVRPG